MAWLFILFILHSINMTNYHTWQWPTSKPPMGHVFVRAGCH